MGEYFTDADLRLFPTIVRYDAVYSCLFKCTRYRIKADFPNIQAWMQDVWLIGNDFELGSLRVSSRLLSSSRRHRSRRRRSHRRRLVWGTVRLHLGGQCSCAYPRDTVCRHKQTPCKTALPVFTA